MNHNKYVTLARREFWEYRSLWIAPSVVTGLLFVMLLVIALFASQKLQVEGWGNGLSPSQDFMRRGLFQTGTQIFGITGIVGFLFLLDCLNAERKDRSILFWKSLPVSDTATVLAKYVVGLVLVPLFAFALVSLAFPLIHLIGVAAAPEKFAAMGSWKTLGWLRAEGLLLVAMFANMLWYAPVAAWALLASVAAGRMPILYAFLPVVAVGVGENIALQSTHVWRYLGLRLLPLTDVASGLQRLDLWLGVLLAAAMIYATIRVRRYRDDT